MMMKRALLAVAVAMIAITSCGGSGKQVVGTYCRVSRDQSYEWNVRWKTVGAVWLVFRDGSTDQLFDEMGFLVSCFAGVDIEGR
jgi:hypothetical protein